MRQAGFGSRSPPRLPQPLLLKPGHTKSRLIKAAHTKSNQVSYVSAPVFLTQSPFSGSFTPLFTSIPHEKSAALCAITRHFAQISRVTHFPFPSSTSCHSCAFVLTHTFPRHSLSLVTMPPAPFHSPSSSLYPCNPRHPWLFPFPQ